MNDISGGHNQGGPMGGHMVPNNQTVGIGVGVGGQAIIGQQNPMSGGGIQQAMINQNQGPQQGNPGQQQQQQQQPTMMNPAMSSGGGEQYRNSVLLRIFRRRCDALHLTQGSFQQRDFCPSRACRKCWRTR